MIRSFSIFFVTIFAKICYRHKVYGTENLPPGGAIIACNHASYLDPPLLGISCPHFVHFLARKSLYTFRPFGWLLKQLYTHPVARGQGNVDTFRITVDLIKSGKKVAIFPEGARTEDGELQEGLQGVGVLVRRGGCSVIPVYVHGTFEVWSIHRRFPKLSGRTACVFGKPISFPEVEGKESKQQIADTIMEAIDRLKAWYLAGAQGTPP